MSYMAVSGSTLTKIGTALQTGANVVVAAQGQQQFDQFGRPIAFQDQGMMPDWLMPLLLVGGLGAIAFIVMRKK